MELALAYALMDTQRREEQRREEALDNLPVDWYPFHASQDHKISVFAGRRTGKTYNLALRAARSQYNCTIFTHYEPGVGALVEALRQIADTYQPDDEINRFSSVQVQRDHGRIVYANNRMINIYRLPRNGLASGLRGLRWTNQEIMFDEFEHSDFESMMNAMAQQISQARHIVCVGSINRMEDSFAKRWFKESGLHYFVDAEYQPPTRGHLPAEYFPSRARHLINQLPPLAFSFS